MDIEELRNEFIKCIKDNFSWYEKDNDLVYEVSSELVDIVIDTLLRENPELRDELVFDER